MTFGSFTEFAGDLKSWELSDSETAFNMFDPALDLVLITQFMEWSCLVTSYESQSYAVDETLLSIAHRMFFSIVLRGTKESCSL